MEKYKILRKGVFETQTKFEERLNSESLKGWKALSISAHGTQVVILLEKT